MSAMAAPGVNLAPDLPRYGLNILDTQAAGVVDPVEVIKALMFRLVFPGRHQHVSRDSPLIGFGLSIRSVCSGHQAYQEARQPHSAFAWAEHLVSWE